MTNLRRQVACASAIAGAVLALAAAPASARTTTVFAGSFDVSTFADLESFFPANVQIHVGDSVVWKFHGFHTVVFAPSVDAVPPLVSQTSTPYAPQNDAAGNPWWWSGSVGQFGFDPAAAFPSGGTVVDGTSQPNSGLPQGRFEVTFTRAGTYSYFCAVHHFMKGTVTVVPQGRPDGGPGGTQDGQRAQQQIAEQTAAAQALSAKVTAIPNTSKQVLVGAGNKHLTLLHFFPSDPVVHTGDVLTFKWQGQEPHTVTFADDATTEQLAQVFLGPPPSFTFDPVGALPSEPPGTAQPIDLDPSLHGTGFLNSGVFDPSPVIDPVVPGTAGTFKVRFTTPGTYHFECLIHPGIMEGDVTVLPRG